MTSGKIVDMLPAMTTKLDPGSAPAQRRGKRRFLEIVEALRPLGLTGTPSEVALALLPLLEDRRWAIRLRATTIQQILEDNRHQDLINAVVHAGMKDKGYEARYKDFYPAYVDAATKAGFTPLGLGAFQNRALHKRLWWERQKAYPPHHAQEPLPPASGE